MASANKFVLVKQPSLPTREVKTESRPLPAVDRQGLSAQTEPSLNEGSCLVVELEKRELSAKPKRGRNRATQRGVPDLPPMIEVAMSLPFRIRYILASTVAFANSAVVTRGGMAAGLGCICYATNADVAAIASSYRIRSITAWPAAGGDFGILSQSAIATAEQALQKDSEKIAVLPTGITVPSGGRVFRFPATTFLGMWQMSAVNAGDTLFEYWGTAGTVFDVEGVFTLVGPSIAPYTLSIGSGAAGSVYYLSPDGNTAHNWVPQGLPTTH